MSASHTANGHVNGHPSSSGRPTILLVTGAWHVPEHYRLVSDGLRSQGFRVSVPRLPSNTNTKETAQLADLDDDIAFIHGHAKQLLAEGQDLLVLMHSYGGVVGSYALSNMPTRATSTGNQGSGAGRLLGLLYMTSFITLAGESLTDIFGGGLPPFLPLNKETGEVILSDECFNDHFYQDCTEEQRKQASALLVRHGIDAQFKPPRRKEVLVDLGVSEEDGALGRMTMAYAQEGVKVGYIFCDVDAGLPVHLQEMMVGRIKKLGVQVREWHVAAGHSPFYNKPEDIVEAVGEMAASLS